MNSIKAVSVNKEVSVSVVSVSFLILITDTNH